MKKIKNYVLENQIGKGKYGIVFKGVDLNTNQTVAIKVIQKKLLTSNIKRELLISEIKIMKKLQQIHCSNIIQFLDYIETARNCYIIMEYCDGGDLKQYLSSNALDEQTAVQKFREVLKGMKVLFENNIIHRDLKTANIFIHNGQLKIGDFGFAIEGEPEFLKLGTPLYMAPELLQGLTYTNKIDVWALGVIFYQMILGDFPYKEPSEQKLIEATKIHVQFNNVERKVSKQSLELLQKMLEPDQIKRISMKELLSMELFYPNEYQQNLYEVKESLFGQDIQGESTKDAENTTKSPSQQQPDDYTNSLNLPILFNFDNNIDINQ